MSLQSKITTLALAAATAATVAVAGSPAQAEDGRNGAFLGGMLLGSLITNGGGYGYAAPMPAPRRYVEPRYVERSYPAPRVIVRREYYPVPRGRWHHRRERHWYHDEGYHRGWDDR